MSDEPSENRTFNNARGALFCTACGCSLAELGTCPECAARIPPAKEGLASTVGRGASWMMLGTGLGKAVSLVAQVILGYMLTDVEFGVFAAAAAIGWFIGILKDAGTNTILLQRGAEQYNKVAGPLFWMNATLSIICGIAIAGIALSIHASSPLHPETVSILLVIALASPMQVVGGQLQTKLRQDLRFARYSQIQLTSAVIRQVATVVLALWGFGAMSFAWPYIACALYEGIDSYRATREPVWKRKPEFHVWGSYMRQGLWTVAGTASNYTLDQGAYLVLGSLASKAIVGQFYFAFQLTAQAGVLLGYAVQQVLIPALVQLNKQAERQAEAALRALRVMSLVGSLVCVGLSVCIEPLETIVWHGRWATAVPAIAILGIFFTWRINFGLTTALLHAQGRFKRHALLTAFEGVGLMVVTAIATTFKDADATLYSWWIGVWLMIGRLVVTLLVFRALDVRTSRVLAAMLWSWLLAVGSGSVVLGLDHWLHLSTKFHTAARDTLSAMGVHPSRDWMVITSAEGMRLALMGGLFLLLFLALSRVFIKGHLMDTLSMVPVRFRGTATRLLALPSPEEAGRTREGPEAT